MCFQTQAEEQAKDKQKWLKRRCSPIGHNNTKDFFVPNHEPIFIETFESGLMRLATEGLFYQCLKLSSCCFSRPDWRPWAFEDVTSPPLTFSFKNVEVIWVIRISSGPTAARVARNSVNKSISKTQTSSHILHAVIYVRNKEQKQKQRNSEIYFGMNNSYVEKGCLPFDRKIRLGCPKQIKKYQNRYFLFMRVKYKEEANLWGGSLEPIQLVNGLVSVVQAPSSWYLGSKMVMCRPPFPIAWVVFSLTLFSLLSFESLAQARLQHSPYFCVFKYARTVKLNLERGWKRRAKLGLTLRNNRFWEKKIPTVLQARSTG